MAGDGYSSDPGDYGMPDTSNGSPGGSPGPAPGNDANQIQGWYQQFMGRNATDQEVQSHLGNPGGLGAVMNLIANSPEAQAYAAKQRGSGDTTSPPGTGGGLIDVFKGAAPTPQGASVGAAPVFTPPGYTPPAAFKDPTAAEAAAEPGYDFALKQGLGSVEASAAARGTINSGGTLKDIFDYGSHAATQNYQNVDNRARQNYLMNYQTQYTDPYQFAYRGAVDAFAPKMTQYAAENGAALQNASMGNNMNYNEWLQAYNIFRNRQLDTVNANSATA